MKRNTQRSLLAVLTMISLCGDLLGASAIGTAVARGPFEVDRARVEQATLFEGSTIATGNGASEVALNNGSRLILAPQTRGTVYRDRLVLEAGQAQLTSVQPFGIETGRMRIQPSAPGATARLARNGDTLQIAALKGAFMVRDLEGRLLANIASGENIQLQGSPSATATAKLIGKVVESGGKYFLTDETTKITVELRGDQVRKLLGKRVQVTGSVAGEAPTSGSALVVAVTSIHAIAGGAPTTAVVAGVMVASGAGIGLGVGLTREDPKPSASK